MALMLKYTDREEGQGHAILKTLVKGFKTWEAEVEDAPKDAHAATSTAPVQNHFGVIVLNTDEEIDTEETVDQLIQRYEQN